ncbi:MAG: hypothetical protein E3J86_03155 [Candidatus Thorarchaeota archaeon]|nr:MAG: hypothetical protein E3J86_03155 [Candidatus Thorarchaeota archaeon]
MKSTKVTTQIMVLTFIALILFTPTLSIAQEGMSKNFYYADFTNPFIEGSYLEYLLGADIIRTWNYTVEDGSIESFNGSIYYEPNVRSEIHISLNVTTIHPNDDVDAIISYVAETTIGYEINAAFQIRFNPMTGNCIVQNGSLEGFEGTLTLLYDNLYPEEGATISSLDSLNVTIEDKPNTVGIEILDGFQATNIYNCSLFDTLDGSVYHRRYYDQDTAILLQSFGANGDRIFLGLANISYVSGLMRLVATNVDIGFPLPVPIDPNASIPILIGVGSVSLFAIFYIMFYRAQRKAPEKPKKGKSKWKKSR